MKAYLLAVLICLIPSCVHAPGFSTEELDHRFYSIVSGDRLGSGVPIVYDGDAFFLTCAHVIYDESLPVMIENTDGQYTFGTVLVIDRDADYSIVTPWNDKVFREWTTLTDEDIEVGETVYHFGWTNYREGYGIAVGELRGYFQNGERFSVSSRIISGSSGGPVFTRDGRLVGIVTHTFFGTGGFGLTAKDIYFRVKKELGD